MYQYQDSNEVGTLTAQTSTYNRIAVLGSTGMLGQTLCQTGRNLGASVFGIARRGAEQIADVVNSAQLFRSLDAIEPDLIINASAQTNLDSCESDPEAAYAINAAVVAKLVNYCASHGIKLVQISTDHYFTGDINFLHSEDHPVQLLNEYARTKFAGEAFAETYPNSLVIRTNLVGFRGWANQPTFIEWAINQLVSGKPMVMFDDFYTSSLDVLNFSYSLFNLIEKRTLGLLNLAARESVSKAQFLTKLAQTLGFSTNQCRIGSVRELSGAYRAESLGLNVSKAEAILGRELPGTDGVIASLVKSHKEKFYAI